MSIPELFIRRPVATVLVMLGILLFGVAGYRALPVSDLPNVDYPTIHVRCDPARSERRHDGLGGSAATREAVFHHPRSGFDELPEHHGQDRHHLAVCPEPRHRRRGAGCPGRYYAGLTLVAAEHAGSSVVQQSQSGRVSLF